MKKVLFIISTVLLTMNSVMAQNIIDVHTHNILPEYLEVLKKHHAELEETFPLPAWNVDAHLNFMDENNIEYAVLSMPAPQPFYGDVEESKAIIRKVNELTAITKSDHPDRFKFCAALPLPDVNAAIEEAIYALDVLGADGIKLASNSRGQYIGDAELDPLMEVLNDRHAVVIIHPHRPTPFPEEIIKTTPLAIYEYPAETTRAIVNMITRNVMVRYPNIKIVVPHCGSFLPMAIPRMKAIHPIMLANGLMDPIDWEGNLSGLYYDLAGGATPEVVRMLLTITTPDHIMYGSDYPYQPANVLTGNLNKLRGLLKNDAELAPYAEGMLYRNAKRLFDKKETIKK